MARPLTSVLLLAFALTLGFSAHAQQEGLVPTQALVNVDPKSTPPANAAALTVSVNDRKQPLSAWDPVPPANVQVALLIDDGLRESVSRELDNLRNFVRSLAPGVEVLVGTMQYGHVVADAELHHRPRAGRLHASPALGPARHEREPVHLPLGLRQELARPRRILLQQLACPIHATQGALYPDAQQRRRSLQWQYQHDEPGQPLR